MTINWALKKSSATNLQNQIQERKIYTKSLINETINETRSMFVTPLVGQDSIYLAKEQEAIRYLSQNPEPTNLNGYYHLQNEVGITAETAYQLAQMWVNMGEQWRYVSGIIEGCRMKAYKSLNDATTLEDIDEVIPQLIAELSLLPTT